MWCPWDGDIRFTLGPAQFGFGTVQPSKILVYLKVPGRMLADRLSQRLGEDHASHVGQEKGKIDMLSYI